MTGRGHGATAAARPGSRRSRRRPGVRPRRDRRRLTARRRCRARRRDGQRRTHPAGARARDHVRRQAPAPPGSSYSASISFDQVRDLGLVGVLAVIAVVVATFLGIQLLGRLIGVQPGLGLLVATGYSICGASAVAAMKPLADADGGVPRTTIGLGDPVRRPADRRAAGDEPRARPVRCPVRCVGRGRRPRRRWGRRRRRRRTPRRRSLRRCSSSWTRVILLAPLVAGVGVGDGTSTRRSGRAGRRRRSCRCSCSASSP